MNEDRFRKDLGIVDKVMEYLPVEGGDLANIQSSSKSSNPVDFLFESLSSKWPDW